MFPGSGQPWKASGVYHDAIVYNTILDGCSKHRRPDLVDKVLDSMDKHRISPTNFTLGSSTRRSRVSEHLKSLVLLVSL